MSRCNREAIEVLDAAGAVFVRKTKHQFLYRLPNGRMIGFSTSPSDQRSIRNFKSDLTRALTLR